MATQVLKRDNSVQPFEPAKIKNSILAAANEAGIAPETAQEIAEKVLTQVLAGLQEKEQVSFAEIREAVFANLREIEPRIIQAWERYEREVKGLAI